MFKFIKNKFLFILLISIATLAVLIVGALTLYKDNSRTFANDGYIIETSTKTNQKYYFSANTKYKENVEEKITFSDKESNTVAVDPASFVHYANGNVSFLQKGALVNLSDITSPMVSYYNITNDNTIVYEDNHYTVTSNDRKINIDSFVGRISDNKYLIAGKDLTIKIPTIEDRISGDYFEILYVEEGIIKIDNEEHSYQVTAQDSYAYIGDNITISLGDGKIFHDGDAKMLLSQITISGNENINLDVDEKQQSGGGSGDGSGSGTGEGSGENGDGVGGDGDGEGDGTGSGDGTGGDGEGTGEGDGTGGGSGGSGDGTGDGTGGDGTGGSGGSGGGGVDVTTASPKVELIEAIVTSTTIDLSLQLNNANLAKGNVVAYLTNVATGAKETPKTINLTNGTFTLPYSTLVPNTEYALTIVETGIENEKQYFQKTFRTKELGIALEKNYATDSSLAYNILFDENTDVTKVHISIYDNNGTNTSISPNEFTISRDDLNNSAIFTGLQSNTSYSINVDTVWIDNIAYSNLYTINRIDTTLKQTPKISGIDVDANSEEVKFTIKLNNVTDKDKSIVSYTYNIYLATDITVENLNPEVQYSITKNDSDPLVLNLNEIDELNTGVDYRCKIIAQYNDNEMIREVSTDYSSNFLIKSKPKINFELKNADMSGVEGILTLIDANCTVPMRGRQCSNSANNFTIRYYDIEKEETNENDTSISFNPETLTSELILDNLTSNTTYAVKLFGNYYDDDNILHPNVQIGDTFYVKTDKSPNIYFKVVGDNKSGEPTEADVVTFKARLEPPQNIELEDLYEEISNINFKLYSGRYNNKEKLIGTYTITDKNAITDLFNEMTIKNSLFEDATQLKKGKLDSLADLIAVTNNSTKTLNSAYTVEVEGTYKSGEKILIEDSIYTFNLTASYYLDARIATNPNETYITVSPILKKHLTTEEMEELAKKITNLEELNDETIVGLTIENSLSDIFVDSAFTYEKVVVDYTIYNNTTKKETKTISVDMGNKYQPKTQTIYLDSSELDDGNKYFTRGYKYKIGYTLNFVTEDGSNPVYTNDKLYKIVSIDRQDPIYTQYISTSDSNGVTYRYSFKDTDGALFNKNFYYTLGEDKENYNEIKNSLVANNEYKDVTIPLNTNSEYTLYYARKNTDNEIRYVSIATNDFETEYKYDNKIAYTILNEKGNLLKIKLEDNDVTNRAVAYKVVINTNDKKDITEYTRYFLAAGLNTIKEETGEYDEEGNPITKDYKYIAIDYANISRFMGYNMNVSVYSYYDNGLMGYNQKFDNGFMLKNREKNKYLNIFSNSSTNNKGEITTTSTYNVEDINRGILLLKESYNQDGETIYIYNKLVNTDSSKYNSLEGSTYTNNAIDNFGIIFNTIPTNAGMNLTVGKTEYKGYDAKVLNEAELKTTNNKYKFDAIIPTVKVTTNKNNTINSIKIDMEASGMYGNKQFTKDGVAHNKIYVEVYSDEECTKLLTKKETTLSISGSDSAGYKATINSIEIENLTPETTYYFKVYAYIDNDYTQLYDISSKNTYITKTYTSSTLDAKGLISTLTFAVEPKAYAGEISQKELKWRLVFKNNENYKIRFELYKPDPENPTTTTIDPETGETTTVKNFIPVNFDGTTADTSKCNTEDVGKSSNGYVTDSKCYISIAANSDKGHNDNIANLDQKNGHTYQFTNNDFVFGGGYYKLVVYAVPYTNGKYVEDQKVLIYQNDSLTSGSPNNSGFTNLSIKIDALEEATIDLKNTLKAGFYCEEYKANSNECEDDAVKYYYISFVPQITDNHYVIKNGAYTVKLKDEKGNVIKTLSNVIDGIKNGNTVTNGGTANKEIKFTSLDAEIGSNTLYYVELSYETYRNNVGYTEEEKTYTIPFTDFIYTPIDNDITLGTVTAGQATAKSVTLTYNGSSNLTEIIKATYTISLKGGSSKATGTYTIDSEKKDTAGFVFVDNIFGKQEDKTPKWTIDVSNGKEENQNFTFKSGNTYIITTQYWYMRNGQLVALADQINGNTNFTTILNL